jgi:putative heme iron utilization protein
MTPRDAPSPVAELEIQVRELFRTQGLAVLSTQGEGQPYSSLVAFAATPGLDELLFATTRTTRKYSNLATEPRVSFLIDNRSNREADFHEAMAATAVGRAREAAGANLADLRRIYLAKHPYLEDFLAAPTCALIQVRVEAYYVVERFQDVRILRPKP